MPSSRDSGVGVGRTDSRKRAGSTSVGNSTGFGGLSDIQSETPISGSALVRRRLDLR